MRCSRLVMALVGIVALPTTAVAEPARSPSCRDFVVEAAQIAGLPLPWIDAVMRAESGGDAHAISAAGALGCMQILPSTWRDLQGRGFAGPDPFDPRANMIAGAVYLRTMHDRYGWPDALAAYHAGIGRFEEYLASGRPLPKPTLTYVERISRGLNWRANPVPRPLAARVPSTDAAIFIGISTVQPPTPKATLTKVPAEPVADGLIPTMSRTGSGLAARDTIFVRTRP